MAEMARTCEDVYCNCLARIDAVHRRVESSHASVVTKCFAKDASCAHQEQCAEEKAQCAHNFYNVKEVAGLSCAPFHACRRRQQESETRACLAASVHSVCKLARLCVHDNSGTTATELAVTYIAIIAPIMVFLSAAFVVVRVCCRRDPLKGSLEDADRVAEEAEDEEADGEEFDEECVQGKKPLLDNVN